MELLWVFVLTLLLTEKVLSFTVSGEVGPITVRRGGNITLNCYVRGADYDGLDHTIKWVKLIEGKHHVVSTNTIINKKLSEHKYSIAAIRDLPTYFLDLQLRIIDIGLEDNGTYLCEVLGIGGHITVGDHLVDLIVGEQVKTLEMVYDREGSNSTLFDEEIRVDYTNPTDITCQASGGNPPPKLRVYLGHNDVTTWFVQRRMSVTYSGSLPWDQKFVYQTQITCPTCKLRRSDNTKLLQCESTVSEFENIVTTSKPLSITFAPIIDCPDKFLAAKGSENFLMKCTVTANPGANLYRWQIGHGGQLEGNQMTTRYKTTSRAKDKYNSETTLTIFRVTDRNFRIRYKLTISNERGSTTHLMTLSPGGQPDRHKAGKRKNGGKRGQSSSASTVKPYVRASGQATFFYNQGNSASRLSIPKFLLGLFLVRYLR